MEPHFETRYREIERTRCAFFVDGLFYTQTETKAYCLEDPDQTSTLQKKISKGANYFDPNIGSGAGCIVYPQEFIPPLSSWTGPACVSTQAGGPPIGFEEEVGTSAVVTDEELKGDVLTILRNASYREWSLSSSPSSLFAYGSYSENSGLGFAEEHQFRVVHLPSPTCYLKVWISFATYAGNFYDGLGSKISEFDEIYEWKPTLNPCLTDTTKSAAADEQVIRSEIYTISPSKTNVTTIAQFKKFSFLPNYEPDDPIFVDPFQFNRPTPDFNTDGIPQPYHSV